MPSVLLSTVGIMAFHKTLKVLIVKSIVLSDTEWLIPWKSSVDICLFVETMTWTKKACNVLCWRVWAAQREREVGVEELRKQKTLTNGGGPSGAAIGPSLTSSLIILMTRPRYTSTLLSLASQNAVQCLMHPLVYLWLVPSMQCLSRV